MVFGPTSERCARTVSPGSSRALLSNPDLDPDGDQPRSHKRLSDPFFVSREPRLTLVPVTLAGDERDARVRPRYTRLVADPFGYANPQDIVLDRTSTRSPAKTRPGLSCRFRPTGSTEVIIDRTRQPRGATWSLISRSLRQATTYWSTCSRLPTTLRVESRGQKLQV
jgi:hypothetical protein